MEWLEYHFAFASKFRLRLLATRAYNLINPEIKLHEMQEYTSLVGDLSKDSLISECSRLLRIIAMRKLSTKNADFPAPPHVSFKPLTGRDDCGCGMTYPSAPKPRVAHRGKAKCRPVVKPSANYPAKLKVELEVLATATFEV